MSTLVPHLSTAITLAYLHRTEAGGPLLAAATVHHAAGGVALILLLLGLVPFSAMVGVESAGKGGAAQAAAMNAMGLIFTILALAPFFLSLVPGTLRGMIDVKTLVPESTVPGTALIALAFPYALMMLLFFVPMLMPMDLVTGLAALLFFGAPLIYVFRAPLFLRTTVTPEDRKGMVIAQWIYLVVSALGVFTLLIGMIASSGG